MRNRAIVTAASSSFPNVFFFSSTFVGEVWEGRDRPSFQRKSARKKGRIGRIREGDEGKETICARGNSEDSVR